MNKKTKQLFPTTGIEGGLDFKDLVDITGFERLLEKFFMATGIPNGLVGRDGEIITKAGWIDACDRFHRGHPDAGMRCQESNLELMRNLRGGEIAYNLCRNGLIDYATPVVIEGRNLATLFLGQVLSEPPDMAFFRRQASKYGFDEAQYLQAIRAVPVVSKARMESIMDCVVEMTQMLAANSLARLREVKLEADLRHSSEQRIQLMEKYARIFSGALNGIFQSTPDGSLIIANSAMADTCGYDSPEDIMTSVKDISAQLFYQPTEYDYLVEKLGNETFVVGHEAKFRRKNGELIVVLMNARLIESPKEGYFEFFIQDITDRKRDEEELRKHRQHLEELVKERIKEIETLRGILPICASCKKIRDDKGCWNQIEAYVQTHSEAEFSHGICPGCAQKHYAEFLTGTESG